MALSTRSKVATGVVAALAVLGGAVAFGPSLLFGETAGGAGVSSIRDSSEYQDPALLERAWALPAAQRYRPGFESQPNPSFCGPTSVVNVMRSLQLQGDDSTVLDGTGVSTVFGLVPGGVSLDQLAGVARQRVGRKVTVLRDLDLATFRAQLGRTNDPAVRAIINFSRGPLFGTGGGHHSPIGGYLQAEDLVFVLDVNAKYRPWLVKSERLLQAMNTVDRSVGLTRGLLLIEEEAGR